MLSGNFQVVAFFKTLNVLSQFNGRQKRSANFYLFFFSFAGAAKKQVFPSCAVQFERCDRLSSCLGPCDGKGYVNASTKFI